MLARHQLLLGTGFFRMATIFVDFEFLGTHLFGSAVFLSILYKDLLKWHLIQSVYTYEVTVAFPTTLALKPLSISVCLFPSPSLYNLSASAVTGSTCERVSQSVVSDSLRPHGL